MDEGIVRAVVWVFLGIVTVYFLLVYFVVRHIEKYLRENNVSAWEVWAETLFMRYKIAAERIVRRRRSATRRQQSPRELEKRFPCPHCAEEILPKAKICRFCRSALNENWATENQPEREPLPKGWPYDQSKPADIDTNNPRDWPHYHSKNEDGSGEK